MSENYGINFSFLTYGTNNDVNVVSSKYFSVFPMFKKYIPNSNILTIFTSIKYLVNNKEKFEDIDLIHHNQLNGMWLGIFAKFLLKKPLLFRSGYDTYRFSRYEKKSMLKKTFFYLLTNFSLFYADLYTVTSESDLNYSKNYPVRPKKIELRRNWVNEIKIDENEIRKNDIISVGRLEKQKNYKKVLDDFKSNLFSIIIYGDGSEFTPLSKEIKENNLNIQLKGTIPNERLSTIYKECKFFISTSLFEGNPKTVLEAMSAGCIPILSNIDNHKELVDHNKNGFLVNLEDNFESVLSNIIKNKTSLSELSINARIKVQENNSLKVISNQIFSDYKELIKSL